MKGWFFSGRWPCFLTPSSRKNSLPLCWYLLNIFETTLTISVCYALLYSIILSLNMFDFNKHQRFSVRSLQQLSLLSIPEAGNQELIIHFKYIRNWNEQKMWTDCWPAEVDGETLVSIKYIAVCLNRSYSSQLYFLPSVDHLLSSPGGAQAPVTTSSINCCWKCSQK